MIFSQETPNPLSLHFSQSMGRKVVIINYSYKLSLGLKIILELPVFCMGHIHKMKSIIIYTKY